MIPLTAAGSFGILGLRIKLSAIRKYRNSNKQKSHQQGPVSVDCKNCKSNESDASVKGLD